MVSSSYSWLPAHHLPVAATLAHADELIEQVGDLLIEYQAHNDDVFKLKEVRKGLVSQTIVESIAPLPRKVPLLTADALVTLRAAVEHTLFAEAECLNGNPLSFKEARTVEMPARLKYDEFADWAKNRLRNAPASLKSGTELFRRVSGLQPFHRLDRPDLHPMARLASHTNQAKHRTPSVAAIRMVSIVREDKTLRSVRDLPLLPEQPLQVGQILAETPLGVRVPVALFPSVGINRPGTDEWPILMRELAEIAEWVRTQAIPRLITGGEPPQPELPARYDISVGYPDERRAISLGVTTTAAERNKERWKAASTRTELVGLLQEMPNAPGGEQIAAWLKHLSDTEVLERISGVRPSQGRDKEALLASYAALESLRDEAVTFSKRDLGDAS